MKFETMSAYLFPKDIAPQLLLAKIFKFLYYPRDTYASDINSIGKDQQLLIS